MWSAGRVIRGPNTGCRTAFAGPMKPEVLAMVKKIVATDSPSKRIRDLGSASPRIDPALVVEALGAEDTGMTLGREGSPLFSFPIRAELFDRLRSSKGRVAR